MKNNKFDIDLKYGQEREQKVASLLDADKNKIEKAKQESFTKRMIDKRVRKFSLI